MKMSKVSLRKIINDKDFVATATTIYKYVNENIDELEKKGIIKVSRRGSRRFLYVTSSKEEFKKFFEEKGIYL
ncbi:MAG: hypothetical protein ACPLXO_03000 [Desulfurella sp.]